MRGTKISAVGTNPKFWSSTVHVANCWCGTHSLTCQVKLWLMWSKLHVKENVIGFLKLSWYQLFGKPQHHPCGTQHGWFWHIDCSWLLPFLHQSSWTKFAKFFWKLSLGEPNGHHLGKYLLCPNGRSLGQGLAPASWPQFFLVQEGLGQSPYWFMFLSLAKREGRNPNLWRVSGMWNCQCHFLTKDISGKAWWKVWMACSTAGNKVVLVMRPDWFPSWTWSMKAAIARKAWQASGLWPLGIATLWMKCLMVGNMAKHSETWQEGFPFCLWLVIFLGKVAANVLAFPTPGKNPMGKIAF